MNLRLLLNGSLWLTLFLATGCGQKANGQIVGEARAQQSLASSPTPTPSKQPTLSSQQVAPAASPASTTAPSGSKNVAQGPSLDLPRIENSARPAVIWVTVFDRSGNLLRTETGFFISADGRFVTTARAIEGGVNAVAKTAEGGIYNVTGILTASKELDLAVLQADVKPRKLLRFLDLNKNSNQSGGAGVVVVGCGLAGNEGSAREMTISAQEAQRLDLNGATPPSSVGSPVVNEAGEVVGMVTSAGEKTTGRPAAALESLLARVAVDTRAKWPATAETSPTPKPTPKPRIIYAPAPAFPPGVSQSGVTGTGRFRLTFDSSGNVTNVQVVKSTGNAYFDQAAIKTFRQWKSAPSQGWAVTVPVTFQTR